MLSVSIQILLNGMVFTIYSYRLLRSYFTQTAQWRAFDPFSIQKQETFRGSAKAIYRECASVYSLIGS